MRVGRRRVGLRIRVVEGGKGNRWRMGSQGE